MAHNEESAVRCRRGQISMQERYWQRLASASRRLGVSRSELVRRLLDRMDEDNMFLVRER